MVDSIILKEIGYWEDALCDELSSEEVARVHAHVKEALRAGINASKIYASIVVWQWEDKKYGLKHVRAVREDTQLSDFCDRTIALYRREIAGEMPAQKEFQSLYGEIAKAWDIAGERERVARMKIARTWAWAGGRTWAWIGRRGWRKTWAWVLTATRQRNMTQAVTLTSTWVDAFKWSRVWESSRSRIRALRAQFLQFLDKGFNE